MVDWVAGQTVTAPAAWYVGLSTAQPADDGSGIAEPAIGTGAYARSTSIGTTASRWTAAPNPSNDANAVSAANVAIAFPASSAAWSTTSTNLPYWFLSDSTTSVTEANYIGRGNVTNPTNVNASGITLTFAIGALTNNCIST